MASKTAKPCYRIETRAGVWIITAFPVVNRVKIQAGSVTIPKGTSAELKAGIVELIEQTRAQFGSQRSV